MDHFTISTITEQTEDQDFSITITAKDSGESNVTGFTGTVNLSDSTGTIVPTTSGPFAALEWLIFPSPGGSKWAP